MAHIWHHPTRNFTADPILRVLGPVRSYPNTRFKSRQLHPMPPPSAPPRTPGRQGWAGGRGKPRTPALPRGLAGSPRGPARLPTPGGNRVMICEICKTRVITLVHICRRTHPASPGDSCAAALDSSCSRSLDSSLRYLQALDVGVGGWWGMYGRHMSPNLKPGSPYAPDSSKSSRLHECLNLVWNLNYPEPGPGALPGGGAPHFL